MSRLLKNKLAVFGVRAIHLLASYICEGSEPAEIRARKNPCEEIRAAPSNKLDLVKGLVDDRERVRASKVHVLDNINT
jgi:hypothetical protein